ncbi:MAG TPA: hypothetical protein VG273_18965 [Bryobacteraceae bacterium]|jgi:uncharacterized protein involved in exopolysaccharide biosynthesis|nr:hypothetical protein [Bryobacteraceae bacterium]
MMDGDFNVLDFAGYVRERWLTVAISCGIAVGLAWGISKTLPRRYTATANVLIALPGGNDPRAATAVSPVYLESLKVYERYASSDTLFVRALDAVHAGDIEKGGTIESAKSRVLKVSKPASTAALEISATMRDAKKAQALAQYIAEQTVELNKSMQMQASTELLNEFRTQFARAQDRYATARRALSTKDPLQSAETLENEVQNAADLKFRLERDLEMARTDLAGYAAETGSDPEWLRRQVTTTQAKIASLEAQVRSQQAVLIQKAPQLDTAKARRYALEREESAALNGLETAQARLNDMSSSSLTHGERLQIIDPGIVPQQPSSPNTRLNMVAALIVSLIGSIVWLGFRFGHVRVVSARSERAFSHSVR